VLLETSSPAAVAEIAADLRLSSAMGIDCWLYTVATHRPVPFYPIAAAVPLEQSCSTRSRDRHPDVDLRVLLGEAAAACRRSPPADHPGMPKGQTCTSFVQSGVGSGQLCRPSAHSSEKRRSGSRARQVCASQEKTGSEAPARTRTDRSHTRGHHGRR
jgi:hypothetical protein